MRLLKGLKIVLMTFGVLAAALAGAAGAAYVHRSDPAAVRQYETDNPHITGRTMVSAHRSGAGVMPEETMRAMRWCAENPDFKPDYFEFDVHATKDGVLVLLHDDELDRTSDSERVFGRAHVRADESTYEELRRLNMGAKFVSDAGEAPYKDLTGEEVPEDLRIVRLESALDYLESVGQFRYIIEIKDGGELGKQAADTLHRVLSERGLVERTAFGSFHGEVSAYVDERYPDLMRGAYAKEVLDFYLAAVTGRKDYTPPCRVLQIPFGNAKASRGVNLGTAQVINYAHAHNMAVQYWTVNREEDMRYLLALGADCIMSDYPDKLFALRQEMGK